VGEADRGGRGIAGRNLAGAGPARPCGIRLYTTWPGKCSRRSARSTC